MAPCSSRTRGRQRRANPFRRKLADGTRPHGNGYCFSTATKSVPQNWRSPFRRLLAAPGDSTAFSMPRRTWYFDRFLRHGGSYPDRLFRLFRPETIRIEESGAHQQFRPSGPCGELKGDLLHYTYANFFNQMDKLNDYAQRGAKDLERKGRRGGIAAGLGHGFWRFFSMYVIRRGFLDGQGRISHGGAYRLLYLSQIHPYQ